MPPKSPRLPASTGFGKNRLPTRLSRKQSCCIVPNCGRPAYARGLCQTHHRQLLTTGKLKAIRPYRKRTLGTVKFSGLRLTPDCAEQVEQYANSRNVSLGAAIAYILEESLARKK